MKTNIPINSELLYKGSMYDVKKSDGSCNGCSFYDAANGCLNKDLCCQIPSRIFVKKSDDDKKVYGVDEKTTEAAMIITGIIIGFILSVVLYNLIW